MSRDTWVPTAFTNHRPIDVSMSGQAVEILTDPLSPHVFHSKAEIKSKKADATPQI
jgi:hypothetical protein